MRTSMFRRVVVMCLLLVLLLSNISIGALAQDIPLPDSTSWSGGTLNITLVDTNKKEESGQVTVTLYKLIDVNTAATVEVREQVGTEKKYYYMPQSPVYIWKDKLGEWIMSDSNENGKFKEYAKTLNYDGADHYIVTDKFFPGEDIKNDAETKSNQILATTGFYAAIEAAIEKNADLAERVAQKVIAVADKNSDGNYAMSFANLPMGVYLITVKNDRSVYRPTVVSFFPEFNESTARWYLKDTVNQTIKGSPVTLNKYIIVNGSEVKETTAAIDDILNYKIVADIPQYQETFPEMSSQDYDDHVIWKDSEEHEVNTFLIEDKITGQTLLPETIVVKCGDTVVASYNAENGAWEYKTVEFKNADGSSRYAKVELQIQTNDNSFSVNINGRDRYMAFLKGNQKVTITYQAKLNQTAILQKLATGTGSKAKMMKAAAPNLTGREEFAAETEPVLRYYNATQAWLTYSNNPYVENSKKILLDSTKVYTYGAKVFKVSATKKDEDGNPLPLSGAEFALEKAGSTSAAPIKFTLKDGIYIKDETGSSILTSDEKGMIKVRGLDIGEYNLTETKANEGYAKNEDSFPIVIKDDTNQSQPIYKMTGDDYDLDENGNRILQGYEAGRDGIPEDDADGKIIYGDCMVPVTVVNTAMFALPETGGLGTVLYTVIGILLMAGGILLVAVFLRKRKKQE